MPTVKMAMHDVEMTAKSKSIAGLVMVASLKRSGIKASVT